VSVQSILNRQNTCAADAVSLPLRTAQTVVEGCWPAAVVSCRCLWMVSWADQVTLMVSTNAVRGGT